MPYDTLHTRLEILRHISGMNCPNCGKKAYIGMVSESEQTDALFCSSCDLRVAICLITTKEPNDKANPR